MGRKAKLPVVVAGGKPFEMGRAVGRKCAARGIAYRRSFAASVEHSTGVAWAKAVDRARLYLPHAEDFCPDFVEELRGYAEGARMPFDEVFTLCCHELLSPRGFRGCTDLAVSGDVTEDGSVLVAHNEDWAPGPLDTAVLVHGKPKGKPEFFATSYAGIFPSAAMNSAGISLTGNALEPNDERIGVPKIFPVRKTLESRRIGEALEYAMPPNRASSYNNICSDKNGEIYSLEGSATDCAWIYAVDGYLVHTNHYTADKMLRFEASPHDQRTSVIRYNRALRLIEEQLGSVTVDSLKAILRDHMNKPGSICRHADQGTHPLDVSETIFSVIFDLTNLRAHVLKGKPCKGEYVTISMDA